MGLNCLFVTPAAYLGPAFELENWPAHSDAAQSELEKLKEMQTHDPVPFPAYDMHGDIIHPKMYRNRLQGALVEIHFNLKHWYIGKEGNAANVFAADIYIVRVISPPPSMTPVSPWKHRILALDPLSPAEFSPRKRSQLAN